MSQLTDVSHLLPAAQQLAPSLQSSAPQPQVDWSWEKDPLDPPPHETIAREAYALYAARGYQDGWDVEDWFAAEESLRRPHRDEES